jgi:threonine dehydrogenase-like Zn-dependent dehydrogenase
MSCSPSNTAKAMVMSAFGGPLEMQAIPIPELKPGEVLVKMTHAGVCGSDVHQWQGEDPRVPLPLILGHEGVGQVVAICGRKASVDGQALKENDRVLWNRGVTCGQCYYCQIAKEPCLCSHRLVYGINVSANDGPRLNGCYAEFIILRARTDIFKLPQGCDPAVMVSAACSGATMAHAFDLLPGSLAGQTVVVQGPGPLGIFAVAMARAQGAAEVAVIGGSPDRMALCTDFGANVLLNRLHTSRKERLARILEVTGGRGADVVVEAVGTGGVAEEGLDLLRKGGTYLSTGYAQPTEPDRIDFFRQVVAKNIVIKGVWVSDTRHVWQAMNLVAADSLRFGRLISHKFSLAEANKALATMRDKQALKAVLVI